MSIRGRTAWKAFSAVLALVSWSSAEAKVVYVAKTGNDANDGLSWAAAKLTVTAGLNTAVAGDEVWTAAGTYAERITLKAGAGLYGGFAGSEDSLVQRDWKGNVTILDGGAAGSVVTSPSGATTDTRIDGFTIRNGSATKGGGVSCTNASPTIANNTIADNRGPGIFCFASAAPAIDNNTITRNNGNPVGGICCDSSSPAITNNTITNNTNGGIYCFKSSPRVATNVISDNTGAGLCCYTTSSPVIDSNTISRNTSTVAGGIYSNASSPTVTDNTITQNTGHGISCTGSSATITHNTITDNASGTGINCQSSTIATIADNTIRGHTVGGIVCSKSSGSITSNMITHNTSTMGGGIYCSTSSFAITNNIITGNAANGTASYNGGGGICCVSCSPSIENNVIMNNTAACSGLYSGGGGIYCTKSASPTIVHNRIVANIATDYDEEGGGGGIRCDSSSSPSIVDNEIAGNSSASKNVYGSKVGYGGGIYCDSSSPTITNNVIKSNNSVSGGGMYFTGSSALIANNTIVCNIAEAGGGLVCGGSSSLVVAYNTITHNTATYGGGILCPEFSYATIANTIIAFNSSGVYGVSGVHGYPAAPSLRFNCVFGNSVLNYEGLIDPTGTNGNISVDPELANAPYGNVHIQPNSPCVDAGDDSVLRAGWMDMDGQARLVGLHSDIGADESDGTAWAQGPYVIVRIRPDGDDAEDGSSWESAKRTVQAGIDAGAESGGDVWVAAGVYEGCITLEPYVHLYGGFAGSEAQRAERDWRTRIAVLDGKQAGSVVTADHVACGTSTVDGFTIRNGSSGSGAGIRCVNSSPAIINNTIKGNQASSVTSSDGEGGGIYCSSSSPTIANNIISENTASRTGGGICCSESSPTIANNLITANSAASPGGGIYCYGSPAIRNNTITGNSSSSGGGIWCEHSSAPTVANNIVAFNSSGLGLFASNATPTLRNNCVYGNAAYDFSGIANPTGTNGNISSDPRLVDLAHGDVHIQPNSPCIDAGNNNSVPAGALVDLGGSPRFFNDPATPDTGQGTAPIVDIGAYEYIPGDFNRDGRIDAADMTALAACLSGPAIPYSGDCLGADFDRDADVDQSDFGFLQRCFSGPAVTIDPACTN